MDWMQIRDRFLKLYVAAVCDCLDQRGYWHQVLDPSICPLDLNMKVAGPAFTMLGMSSREADKTKRFAPTALDRMEPGVVAVMSTSGDRITGHWGELMTNAAIRRDCQGAVVDGGIRDTWNLIKLKFPIFHEFRSPADALGRFNIVEFQTEIVISGVKINPGDYIFGDADGVVVIPKDLTLEVLEEAESVVEIEEEIRERVNRGEPIAKLYLEYEQF